jgi:formylmethanofuran dehydrogenase subunit C
VAADCISPDVFAEKSAKEIAELQIWEGNRKTGLILHPKNSQYEFAETFSTFEESVPKCLLAK